jgi:uncharacterized protein YjbI with pentapeptide repeats
MPEPASTAPRTIWWWLDSPARLLRRIFSSTTWQAFGRPFPETKALLERIAWPLLAVLMLAGMLLAVWWVPRLYAASLPERAVNADGVLALVSRLEAEQDARALMLQVVGGMVVLITLYRGWREFHQDQQQRSDDMRYRTEELALTRQNIVAERFSRAINQLGSDKMDIRIGGILSLDMLAKANADYHWPIMDVLASYIQENTKASYERAASAVELGWDAVELPPLPNDIYYALLALTNRNTQHDALANNYIDLSGSCLCYAAVAADADLRWCDLSNTHLEMASFRRTDLHAARFNGAWLTGCDLTGANLEAVSFVGAVLDGAQLAEVRGLSWEQLGQAASLDQARLPDYLLADPTDRERAALRGASLPG